MCYAPRMKTVASRELRNHTRRVLERVDAGEDVAITVDGRPVARLTGLAPRRPRWLSRETFLDLLDDAQADAGLATDLAELAPETTDDLDPP